MALGVQLAGADGARSPLAGVWFAAALSVLAFARRDPDRVDATGLRPVGYGLGGAAVLCLPAAVCVLLICHGEVPLPAGYLSWALVVAARFHRGRVAGRVAGGEWIGDRAGDRAHVR